MNPGPSAETTARPLNPERSTRSRTNRAVGADMLPWSRRTERSTSSVSGEGPAPPPSGDDLGAARVADEAVHLLAREVHRLEQRRGGPAVLLAHEGRDGAVEDHAEADRVDRPAHDVEGVRPGMLVPALDRPARPKRPRAPGRRGARLPRRRRRTARSPRDRPFHRSERKARVQSSIATNSTTEPGSPPASREAKLSPVTPPAQPRPNTGTRRTSARRLRSAKARASRLGVAIPVEETVTTVSTPSPLRPPDRGLFGRPA